MTTIPNIYVKRVGTDEIVHTVPYRGAFVALTERAIETTVRGLLRNMNLDKFYVDDTELYAALKAADAERRIAIGETA